MKSSNPIEIGPESNKLGLNLLSLDTFALHAGTWPSRKPAHISTTKLKEAIHLRLKQHKALRPLHEEHPKITRGVCQHAGKQRAILIPRAKTDRIKPERIRQ